MGEPADGPARRNIQISDYSWERLGELAVAFQREERLPRRPTFDDMIRRLLAARDQLAGQYGGQQ